MDNEDERPAEDGLSTETVETSDSETSEQDTADTESAAMDTAAEPETADGITDPSVEVNQDEMSAAYELEEETVTPAEESSEQDAAADGESPKSGGITAITAVFKKIPAFFTAVLGKIKTLPAKTLQKAALITLSALIAVTLGVFFYFRTINNRIPTPKDAFSVIIPEYVNNNSHFIYPSVSFELDGSGYAIQKFSIDSLATVFYLDGDFPAPGRVLRLTDDSGNTYEPDYARVSVNTRQLPFLPFTKPVRHFTLNISDIRIPFSIENNFVVTPVRYSDENLSIINGDSSFIIGNGSFSSAGSNFNYFCKTGAGEGFLFDETYGVAPALYDGYSKMYPISHLQYIFDDGVIIGRYDFPPVVSLDTSIRLEMEDVYKYYACDIELVLPKTIEDEIIFPAGRYEAVLEGFAKQGDYYVLVLHGRDTSVFNKPRVETRIDAQLTITDSMGGSVTLYGRCLSGPAGSDILFDMSEMPDDALRGELSCTLKISNVMFAVDRQNKNIDLAYAASEPAEEHGEAIAAALTPYGADAQIAAYAYENDRLYAIVLERIDGMTVTHKDIWQNTGDGWKLI